MAEAHRVGWSEIEVQSGRDTLQGSLAMPEHPEGIVVFAKAGTSTRRDSRNRSIAGQLHDSGLATLLVDLLTERERRADRQSRHYQYDIARLGMRLSAAVEWVFEQPWHPLRIGLFGACTAAAAALITAAEHPGDIQAVVSRCGRPDLAADALAYVRAPVLLIVGGLDETMVELNRYVARLLDAEHRLEVIPGATHTLREPGALEAATRLSRDWLVEHLSASSAIWRS